MVSSSLAGRAQSSNPCMPPISLLGQALRSLLVNERLLNLGQIRGRLSEVSEGYSAVSSIGQRRGLPRTAEACWARHRWEFHVTCSEALESTMVCGGHQVDRLKLLPRPPRLFTIRNLLMVAEERLLGVTLVTIEMRSLIL
jgi:hypothetical protein